MELRLIGHFSHVGNYKDLHFTWLDTETQDKLVKHCNATSRPYTQRGFVVKMKGKIVPSDIRAMIALDCTIHARLAKYDFVSKLERNRGEHMIGHTLTLCNIAPLIGFDCRLTGRGILNLNTISDNDHLCESDGESD